MPGISNLTKHIQGVRSYQITPPSGQSRLFWGGTIPPGDFMVVPNQDTVQTAIIGVYNTEEDTPQEGDILLFVEMNFQCFNMPSGIVDENLEGVFRVPVDLDGEGNIANPQPEENLNQSDFLFVNIGPNRLF